MQTQLIATLTTRKVKTLGQHYKQTKLRLLDLPAPKNVHINANIVISHLHG